MSCSCLVHVHRIVSPSRLTPPGVRWEAGYGTRGGEATSQAAPPGSKPLLADVHGECGEGDVNHKEVRLCRGSKQANACAVVQSVYNCSLNISKRIFTQSDDPILVMTVGRHEGLH